MEATISKEIYWEMSHRLPFHEGHCKNIHGHSYKLRVDITGEIDSNGFVIDFYDVEKILRTLINELDHGFLCDNDDLLMKNFLIENNFKYFIVPFTTSSENLSLYILSKIEKEITERKKIKRIKVRLHETSDVFAEVEKQF
jgi:6-pyruvoyltetrahydropterin/6-carboxytetrahydropterin synthase